MRKKFLLGATALAAVAVVQWLPASAQAADAIPTVCLTNPAPTGPKGETGPPGEQGPIGPQGPPGSVVVGGPSRQPHPTEVEAPQCEDIEGICIVKLPGEQGPVGDQGPIGEPGPMGEPGDPFDPAGPSRAPHSLTGADPCQGVPPECEITIVGLTGPKGDTGEQGPPGPQGPQGDPGGPIMFGAARTAHTEIVLQQVEVPIPTDCQDYLESLVPVPTTVAPTTTGVGSGGGELPATGNSDSVALAAAALVALGGAVLLVRRRIAV